MTDLLSNSRAHDELDRARRLVSFLDHPDREQRHRALDQIVAMGHHGTTALCEALESTERLTRAGALRGLSRAPSPNAITPLCRYLDTHPDELGDNRAFAMQAIVAATSPAIDDPHRLFHFLQAHLDDSDTFVSAFAFEALGKLGDARALPLVQRGLKNKEPFVAEKAALAMAALAQAPAIPTLNADALMTPDEIGFALQSGQAERRNLGLNELARRVAQGQSLTHIIASLLTGPNRIGRQTALEAIARLRKPEHTPLVLQALNGPQTDDDLRSRALRALAALGPDAIDTLDQSQRADLLRQLRAWISGGDLFVRAAAVSALGALPGPESLKLLMAAARDQDAWIREDASVALSQWAGPSLLPWLDALCNLTLHALSLPTQKGPEGDPTALQLRLIKTVAETARARSGADEGCIEVGLAALRASNAKVRVAGLGLLADQAAHPHNPALKDAEVRLLSAALTSTRKEVILMALDALDAWLPRGSAAATTDLVSLLHTGDEALAIRVIPLLGKAGDIEARGVLDALSHNDNPAVSQSARAALLSGPRPDNRP